MWEFPSIQEFIGSNGFLLCWIGGAFIFSVIAWTSVVFSNKKDAKTSSNDNSRNILAGVGTLFMVLLGSCSVITQYKEASKCRNLDLNRISGIRVRKLMNEDSIGSATIVIKDQKIVQDGLKALRSATNRERQKERFFRGYQIQLIVDNDEASGFYINYFAERRNAFDENDKGKQTNVVIPHCGTESNGFNSDGIGIFSATRFGDWVKENVEPQFKEL